MGYSDQKYIVRNLDFVADSGVATGTYTAGAANTLAAAFALPTFPRRSRITYVKVITKTASKAGSTGPVTLNFLNGTTTFAVATVGTGSVGSEVNVTPTTPSTFAALAGPTVTVLGTATASADTYGAYEVFFESNELPA